MKITGSAPHFFVSDILCSVRYYVDVLGFDEPQIWGEPPCFAMPKLDGYTIMLNKAEDQKPAPNGIQKCWDAYFWCVGLEQYLADITAKGADIIHGIELREYYGMREIAVRDPDGYMLAFGEDIQATGSSSTQST